MTSTETSAPEVNEGDAEDCDACSAAEDQCAFHRGVSLGWGLAAEAVKKVLDA